jgi:aspartate/methionine/tyrosine aminotransferase
VSVPVDAEGHVRLDAIAASDAKRALALWVNSPSNPSGQLDDLGAAAAWGRRHGVPVVSDECYAEFTWDGPARSILQHGTDGVIALHSLSKRSNLAGLRVGAYAGDAELVHYLGEVRKHVGMMVPGPAQAAAAVALADDDHVAEQRRVYRRRLELMADVLGSWQWSGGRVNIDLPSGGFYLWYEVGDAWAYAEELARVGGALVSPGEFYGSQSDSFVRVAVVQPDDRIELVARRLRGR